MEAHHPTGVTPPKKRGLRSAVVSYKSWWCYGDFQDDGGDDNRRLGQNRARTDNNSSRAVAEMLRSGEQAVTEEENGADQ